MKSLKFSTLILALQLMFVQPSWSQSCSNLFLQNELHETKFILTAQQVQEGTGIKSLPLDSVETVGLAMKRLLQGASLKFLPIGSRFAISISRQNRIHLASEGLTDKQHEKLLVFLQVSHSERFLLGVHPLFRNKYYEFEVISQSPHRMTVGFDVTAKLAWDLKIPIESQILSGFATSPTDRITPYQENRIPVAAKVRKDLLSQRSTQETFATCGLASMIKIFKSRKIQYTENELLKLVESGGIRSIQDIFSANPGLSLSQLAQLLQILGRVHGFSVREVKVTTSDDGADFSKIAALAAEGKTTDVIVNFSSPGLGRPGGGHFTPVGGYNSKTKEVLLSEVNLAMNPAFWTADKTLIDAMKEISADSQPRGYLVITWLDPLK